MIAYIKGELVLKTPTYVIIESNGIGYQINISLQTFSALPKEGICKLHTYLSIKEDSHSLYGFMEASEKTLFIHLISVSGIGPNTARTMLSSITAAEIRQAIIQENLPVIQGIKGIGPKSAKRLILELKDKMIKDTDEVSFSTVLHNTSREEALSALIMLGFSKSSAEKSIDKILSTESADISVEEIIKKALKEL